MLEICKLDVFVLELSVCVMWEGMWMLKFFLVEDNLVN